jgi:phytoene synthase
MSSSAELAQCRASLKGGSRSFHLAAGLLPPRVREPAAVLYAFCREADDLVDEGGGASALRVLHARLAQIEHGVDAPVALALRDVLLRDVLQRHQIPASVLGGLLEGFAWDVEGRQYEQIEDVLDYAMRVAGTVGLAMALVMGVRGRRALVAATALGIAMQLTNICRDVADDARLGRLYLPLAWMEHAGIDPQAWLMAPRSSPQLSQVVNRMLALADAFYALGESGLANLPADCRGGIRAASRVYAEIGHTLRRRGCDAMAGRTVVPMWRKLVSLVRPEASMVSVAELDWAEHAGAAAVQPFLAAFPAALLAPMPEGAEGGRMVWVLKLFERLERRSMELRSSGGDASA